MGTAFVVALFTFSPIARSASRCAPTTSSDFLLATGCTATIVVQAFINIGVITSSWPVTGVPLPFISFGGSSLVVSLVCVGLAPEHRSRPAPRDRGMKLLLTGGGHGRPRLSCAGDRRSRRRSRGAAAGRRALRRLQRSARSAHRPGGRDRDRVHPQRSAGAGQPACDRAHVVQERSPGSSRRWPCCIASGPTGWSPPAGTSRFRWWSRRGSCGLLRLSHLRIGLLEPNATAGLTNRLLAPAGRRRVAGPSRPGRHAHGNAGAPGLSRPMSAAGGPSGAGARSRKDHHRGIRRQPRGAQHQRSGRGHAGGRAGVSRGLADLPRERRGGQPLRRPAAQRALP